MRIGGNIDLPYSSPEEWLSLVRGFGYSAVLAPVNEKHSPQERQAYLDASRREGLVIGEVGIWKNPISPDDKIRREALACSCERLALADELGANCCVNIAGARGEVWDGCYAENYAEDTYALIVDTVRHIIDAARPARTFYTLEPMPWMPPDSPDGYLKLIRDVDRDAFGVHLDYTNMINSVDRYLRRGEWIAECFSKLGPYIKSIHAKDITIGGGLPCQIREVPPGTGAIDFAPVLRMAESLGPDTTVFVEHLESPEEYREAVRFIRSAAQRANVTVK